MPATITRRLASQRLSSLYNGLVFYADLWHSSQQGYGTLANGTGVATPFTLVSGNNTVTVTTEGTFIVWLPPGRTGTATSGTATVSGSPQSLVAGNNTVTVTGTGTITIACTDQVTDRISQLLLPVTGAVWGSTGRVFSGGDDYLKYTGADFRSADTAGTLIAWLKTSVGGDILSSADEATATRFLEFQIATQPRILQRNNDTTDAVLGSISVVDNVFHQVAWVSSGTAWSFYADTVLDPSLTIQAGANTGDWFGDTADRDNVLIGMQQRNSGPAENAFTGTIGEVLIWNRALTVAEILNHRNATRGRYGV